MRKNKKIILIVILLIIASLSIYIFLKGKQYVKGSTSAAGEPFIINVTEEKLINEYKNIYNVDYGQKLKTQDVASSFETTALAQIRGESVTFSNYTTENVTTSAGKTCLENNIIAAIISGAGIESTGYKYVENEEHYSSGTQLAIWEFWNTWVENSGAKENGFEKGIGNKTVEENELNGESERKKAQEFANKNTYNVNIYLLKYKTDNTNIDNQPNLIYIEMLDEDEELIEIEKDVEENSDIYILVTNNVTDIVKVGQEIEYNINVYNKNEEEQQNLILNNKLPKCVTLEKVVEIIDENEVELKESKDYNYNKETRKLTLTIDKIAGSTSGTMIDETTGEELGYVKSGNRNYKIIVKVNELKEGSYSREVVNVVEVQKDDRILAREKTTNIISDNYLEVEVEELPEKINEKEQCVIGLKITNKGLINAENVKVKIDIPKEILMQKYKISTLSESGEENVSERTIDNEFKNDSIQILAQGTVYIQFTGIINEIEETKQITIKGTVNDKTITWTTNVQNQLEGGY